jgi:hypothetical protein
MNESPLSLPLLMFFVDVDVDVVVDSVVDADAVVDVVVDVDVLLMSMERRVVQGSRGASG